MIVLLEPARAPGFVSGGYRYQDEICRRLAARGEGQQRAIAPAEFAATVAALQHAREAPTVVVDGLFLESTDRPLPAGTVALLHCVPRRPGWAAVPMPAIATSQRTADAVRRDTSMVAVVRPGLDACFVPGPAPRSPRRRIVCVGTLGPDKGQQRLAAALAAIPTAAMTCELVLVGDANQCPGHAQAVRATAGAVPVAVLGVLPPAAVADELRRADLFVSASRQESFGMAVAEAAACGTPVLAFATGEIDAFVHDGRNGWLVPPTASDAEFAQRLRRLLDEPLALAAARTAAVRPPLHDWDEVATRFRQACRAAGRSRGPAPSSE